MPEPSAFTPAPQARRLSAGDLLGDARTDSIPVVGDSLDDVAPTAATLFQALGFPSLTGFEPERAWQPRPLRDRYWIPIGEGRDGALGLDLKEGGLGLCVGAAGTGKSELLRTILLTLMATHSPDQVAFALGEFRGAALSRFDDAPHVVASALGLAGDRDVAGLAPLETALAAEVVRRRELIARAGARDGLDYLRRRDQDHRMPPLPLLVVAFDDFTEIPHLRPKFLDLLRGIARDGSALHMHVLLTTSRPEPWMSTLDEHLAYRVAMRTPGKAESRAVLGVPHAHTLPKQPGHAYLGRSGGLERFRAAHVSDPSELDVVLRRIAEQPRRTARLLP